MYHKWKLTKTTEAFSVGLLNNQSTNRIRWKQALLYYLTLLLCFVLGIFLTLWLILTFSLMHSHVFYQSAPYLAYLNKLN